MDMAKEIEQVFLGSADMNMSPELVEEKIEAMNETLLIYRSAIKEVKTKLDILDDELKIKRKRNPIEYMKSRVKTPGSIMDKLRRKGFEMGIESAKKNLNDIAGIRVICSFVGDIYDIAKMLIRQDDITLIEEKDYIKSPKPNGYRSLHLVIEVPIFFSDHVEQVRVEVQIRTIAMDFWASLEHKLYYKTSGEGPIHITQDLKECADLIASTDMRMQDIQREVENLM
ncbi:GTP pyrophosphokinase [Clostridium chromiireducens]|uniref:GTP pyrophosphokinase YwaC n=1 Tax=Clostridium chromiireducens TaxID=225345 RepID=A0A1V4IBY2_9CLOT|nr:GTP pyrophosphokinase family protein [Clostridium chromiireducens]OPJ57512.1 GTP pyrophosphokinase YwaC [Clostridium chromiireducens]RII35195.1 GTP pyrophosphokinase family protein [Clostridium chromiireducens]